jgi:hypothetical protein
MSINSKKIAIFLAGVAAVSAAAKYMSMLSEEKDTLAADLNDKAHKVKTAAENFADKAKNYFEELKIEGAQVLKEYLGDVEKIMGGLFGKKDTTSSNPL